MRWEWKIKPLDPATVTPAELVEAKRLHDNSQGLGAVVGVATAVAIYFVWSNFGHDNKWVEYSLFPAIVIGGCLSYRLVYEIAIRFRA
jgi:hypothetical protein